MSTPPFAPSPPRRRTRRSREDADDVVRTPRGERSEKRHCHRDEGDGEEVNMPPGTPQHGNILQIGAGTQAAAARAPSPKQSLFALPPPKLASGLLNLRTSGRARIQQQRRDDGSTGSCSEPRVCHLSDWHAPEPSTGAIGEHTEHRGPRIAPEGLALRSGGRCGSHSPEGVEDSPADLRPLSDLDTSFLRPNALERTASRASIPASIFSISAQSSAQSSLSLQSWHPLSSRAVETPPCADNAFEAHAQLVACPAPVRAACRPARAIPSLCRHRHPRPSRHPRPLRSPHLPRPVCACGGRYEATSVPRRRTRRALGTSRHLSASNTSGMASVTAHVVGHDQALLSAFDPGKHTSTPPLSG